MSGAEHVGIGRVSLFFAGAVGELSLLQPLAHLVATTKLSYKVSI